MGVDGPLDTHVLQRLSHDLGDDPDLIRMILETYVEQFPVRRLALSEAIEAGVAELVVEAAHALASASVTIGVRSVFAPARAIEDRARVGDLHDAADYLAVIDSVFDDVVAAVRQWPAG